MDVNAISTLISTVGFPIACTMAMGFFIYEIYKKTMTQQDKNMERLQEKCLERENKLYTEIDKNRAINEKAIETIAIYAERLSVIQDDIQEIKKDVIEIKSKA